MFGIADTLKTYAMKIMAALLVVSLIGLIGLFLYYKSEVAIKTLEIQKKQTAIVKLQEDNDSLVADNNRLANAVKVSSEELVKQRQAEELANKLYQDLQAKNNKTQHDLDKAKEDLDKLRNTPGTPSYDILNQTLTPELINILNDDSIPVHVGNGM